MSNDKIGLCEENFISFTYNSMENPILLNLKYHMPTLTKIAKLKQLNTFQKIKN